LGGTGILPVHRLEAGATLDYLGEISMRKFGFGLILLALAAPFCPVGSQPPDRNLAKIMKQKLKNAQTLLEGMAMQDFAKIKTSADELAQLSKTAEWMVYKTPKYELHNNEFRRAVDVIYQKAKDKNIDGVALAYLDMTMACIRCHQYVREVRQARTPEERSPLVHAKPNDVAP